MRRAAPRRLGAALAKVVGNQAPDSLLGAVQAAWDDALGPELAAAARPARERQGLIIVECRSAAWASELELMQGELVERLQPHLEGRKIEALRFRVGPR